MILSEPDATACMPGETPIDTMSISTPLAAKKPFLAATTPGHTVAVGETWPNETLVADSAGAAPSATVCSARSAGHTSLIPRCIRVVSLARPNPRRRVHLPAGHREPPDDRRNTLRCRCCGVYVSGPCMLKPDQARSRKLAAATIMAAPTERVLLQWNQFVRQTPSAPVSRVPGLRRRGLFLRKSVRPDLRWGGLGRGVRVAGS